MQERDDPRVRTVARGCVLWLDESGRRRPRDRGALERTRHRTETLPRGTLRRRECSRVTIVAAFARAVSRWVLSRADVFVKRCSPEREGVVDDPLVSTAEPRSGARRRNLADARRLERAVAIRVDCHHPSGQLIEREVLLRDRRR